MIFTNLLSILLSVIFLITAKSQITRWSVFPVIILSYIILYYPILSIYLRKYFYVHSPVIGGNLSLLHIAFKVEVSHVTVFYYILRRLQLDLFIAKEYQITLFISLQYSNFKIQSDCYLISYLVYIISVIWQTKIEYHLSYQLYLSVWP